MAMAAGFDQLKQVISAKEYVFELNKLPSWDKESTAVDSWAKPGHACLN